VWLCVSAIEEVLARFCKQEIFKTDQGSQFIGAPFSPPLQRPGAERVVRGP
jgi:hypothetical protein